MPVAVAVDHSGSDEGDDLTGDRNECSHGFWLKLPGHEPSGERAPLITHGLRVDDELLRQDLRVFDLGMELEVLRRSASVAVAASSNPCWTRREAPGRGCMLGNTAMELLPRDEEAREIVHSGLQAFEQGVEGGLRAAQQAGEIREDVDCHSQARLLVVLVQGLHVTARAELAPEKLQDVIDLALEAITAS